MAQKVNLVIDQGTTFSTSFYFTDESGAPIDFTGYLSGAEMRKTPSSSTVFEFIVSAGSNGYITISKSMAQTSVITPGRYVYDLEVQDPSGVTSRLVEGIVTVTPQVTRRLV
jgi:hypothetical protein